MFSCHRPRVHFFCFVTLYFYLYFNSSLLTFLHCVCRKPFSDSIFALAMRKCSGERSCMSSTFPIAILNGTRRHYQCSGGSSPLKKRTINMYTNIYFLTLISYSFSRPFMELCFFVLFHSCCPHAVMWTTFVHEFFILYSQTDWNLLSSLRDYRKNFWKQSPIRLNSLSNSNSFVYLRKKFT